MKRRVYSAAQVAQHAQFILDVQKSNAVASHLVLRLGPVRSHPQFKALCAELSSLARSMTLQMSFCEQIVGSSVHEYYDVINVILGTTCDYCLESGKTRKVQSNKTHSEVLTPSQAWAIQVERLSGLTISVAHNVSQTSFLPETDRCSVASLAGRSEQNCFAAAASSGADFSPPTDENRGH